ncbi:MAG: rod shape-determining protein MreD [Victivallales bacterium]|nr:rod shape-determining protein MreD [Victivallales bacterium]
MKANLSNREKRSLVEVEVTLHPEVIREAFVGRDGCLWKMLRMAVMAFVFLLALGGELAMPRFFPEVPVRPLTVLVAYWACHLPLGFTLLVAWCSGFLLDAGSGLLPGWHVLGMGLTAGAVHALSHREEWRELGGWGQAALAGGLGTLVAACYDAVVMNYAIGWNAWGWFFLREVLLGGLLAALAAGPVLFFCVDCLTIWGTGKKLFLPMEKAPAEQENMQMYRP